MMLWLCAVTFFAAIAGTMAANPVSSIVPTPGPTVNSTKTIQRTRGPIQKGRLACIESSDAGGHTYRVSSTFKGLTWAMASESKNRKDLLVIQFDTVAAVSGPVNLDILTTVSWWQYIFTGSRLMEKTWQLGGIPCVSRYYHVTMGPSQGTCAMIGKTERTDAGKIHTPFVLQHQHLKRPELSFTQSAIWTFDPKTKYLTPQWVNKPGESPIHSLHVYYDPTRNGFGITGNITAFQMLNHPVRECNLVFHAF